MKTEIVKLNEKRSIAVVSTDDVEPILEGNKTLRGVEQTNTDGFRHKARIPNILMVKWLNEEWARGSNVRYLSTEWDAVVARKLKDPEYAYLLVDGPSHWVGYR
jgi:hypothetical protein